MKDFVIDIRQFKGSAGVFYCPSCGARIDPDDESEAVYKVVDRKVENHDLAEVLLECVSCGSQIRLIGFIEKVEA